MESRPEVTFADHGEVVVELRDGVPIVAVNRPHVLNALTPLTVQGLRRVIATFESDEKIIGLVITGAGKAFCSGADIVWEYNAGSTDYAEFIDALQALTETLRRSRLLIVAAINGVAVGGGLELALACDVRIAAPEAVVGFPEVALGLTVTRGVTYSLPRLVGPSQALELLTTGRSLSAAEARDMGIVDRIERDVVAGALEWLTRVRTDEPTLVGAIKTLVYRGKQARWPRPWPTRKP